MLYLWAKLFFTGLVGMAGSGVIWCVTLEYSKAEHVAGRAFLACVLLAAAALLVGVWTN